MSSGEGELERFNPDDHLQGGEPDRVSDADFRRVIRRFGSRIPFAKQVVAAYYAMRDSRVPFKDRALIAAGIAYLILPFDVIPEALLGGFGLGDDIAVLWKVITSVNHIISDEHRAKADAFLRSN